jgi:dolichyl-diphosphooligosaccharide--protein glycosyltransferase
MRTVLHFLGCPSACRYPLGRIIGFTLYPGLMVTAAVIYWTMHALSLVVHIRDVCVLTAPFFASNTAMVAYFFGKELRDSGAGLAAAAFLSICPGYISRSVAGSYDYEGIAIFALLITFYFFVKVRGEMGAKSRYSVSC